MNTFYLYIKFPDNIEELINSADKKDNFIKDVKMLINRADCERGAIVYYDNLSLEVFLDELEAYEEFYDTLSLKDIIRLLLFNNDVRNWKDYQRHELNEDIFYYREWVPENRCSNDDFPAIFKEVAECTFQIVNKDLEFCLLISVGHKHTNKYIYIIKDNRFGAPMLTAFEVVKNFSDLEEWFKTKRLKRNYNFDDNRHVETHPEYRNGKSPLINGLAGKKNAEELLVDAVGDQKESKDLVNFDGLHSCYIWYEYENASNQYHGYHLVINNGTRYIRDVKEEEKMIPDRAKEIIEYRKSLTSITA